MPPDKHQAKHQAKPPIKSPAVPPPQPSNVTKAMVLAAGLGTRMRPLTDNRPKPLLEVQGRTLIDRILDRLAKAGITDVVINLHHLGSMIEEHVSSRDDHLNIQFSHEEDRLETGGGVKRALPLLGEGPFFIANADILILDGPTSSLRRMAGLWDHERMDAMLLVHSTVTAVGYEGLGDFNADPDGRLTRRPELEVAPWLFAGVQITSPAAFEDTPEGPFSLNVLFDRAIERDRLYGTVHDGVWFHMGTPEGLAETDDFMSQRYASREVR